MTLLRRLSMICIAALAPHLAHAADLSPRTSSAAGVSVNVTPKLVAPDAPAWEFGIALNTHSQDLSDDLVKNSALIDSRGGRHGPVAWEGSPPGGHHRSGVLRFKGLGAQADAIELQIRRPNEAAPRSFR
jgi:hypothetical protein